MTNSDKETEIIMKIQTMRGNFRTDKLDRGLDWNKRLRKTTVS